MIDVRDNWRILMLVFLCVLAALALFGPLGAGGDDGSNLGEGERIDDPTNLQYGLDLSGGTRVRGQLVGLTAENVEGLSSSNQNTVETTVAEELGLDPLDVRTRPREPDGPRTVEVFSGDVTPEQFANALQRAGLDVSTDQIRSGTTSETRNNAVETISSRIDQTGLSGANVRTVNQAGGGSFIVVEVPGADREEVRELIGDPGRVQIVAGFPRETANGTELAMEPLLTQGDFRRIEAAQTNPQLGPHVPVTLTGEAGQRYQQKMQEWGFSTTGVSRCEFDPETDEPSPNEYCLYTVVDGNITEGVGLGRTLADSINERTFTNEPSFVIQMPSLDEAEDVRVDLEAGALPSEFRIESESFRSPSLAQSFKPLSLATGLAAWIAVCIVVYVWYRDVRVAIPMLVTASTEVFLLLGFAAAFGVALDLSHIAGLIAVIGTGLDDLIIMADEILQRKEKVETGRIFQSRFRKAFWVIGMAAATTIVAMSPLFVLSLGQLRGFAIITIVGVLIGVLVTRPAYGDVLRKLMLEDVKRS
ncbi:preprotein translocase subunit SecD [Halobacteriales archaeon SW_7_65_23]|jgi:preprotein translocase subunit SecD|nr:MAG: preprotein translocase subunit SecD [Halobacteriales archaeon SW_7_65_23]